MFNPRIFVFVSVVIVTIIVCKAKRGFILTTPKYLDVGSTEYLTITLSDADKGGLLTFKLLIPFTNDVLISKSIFVHNNYHTWVELDIPDTAFTSAILHVSGNLQGGYTIDAKQEVSLRRQSIITFIQTDNPVYKPGQTVKFRILPMDTLLVPLSHKTFGDVWVEDPIGVKVIQWKSLNVSDGITQLEFSLSKELLFGTWRISTSINNVTESQNFEVEEYVLPKFEVLIKPPPYIMADSKEISVEICSKYTYGKNVIGVLHATMTYQLLSFEHATKSLPSFEYEGKISGCAEFLVDTNELLLGQREYRYRTVKILAKVVENGTGISQSASIAVKITHVPLKLEFVGSEKGSFYFKSGIPYRGNLQATKPDSSPASSETINVCASIKASSGRDEKVCNNFSSNKDGIVTFVVPAQSSEVHTIFLKATASQPENLYSTRNILLDTSDASVALKSWYSPSNNYLQIESITNNVECNRLEKVKIRYTIEQGSTIKFYHQVISRGRIVQLGSHTRSFDSKDALDLDSEDSAYLLKSSEIRQKYLLRTEDHKFTNKTNLPLIGEFTLNFVARSTMSPVARLLVFYVRKDGEIIADSKVFRISHCLQNQVKLLFRHSQQRPNTEAIMLLSANPMSLCGLGIVDKSVHLLSSKNKFGKNKVFKSLESFDVGKYPEIKRENSCEYEEINFDDVNRAQRRIRSLFPMTFRDMDAVAAFDDAGLNVITDLILETAACRNIVPSAHFQFGLKLKFGKKPFVSNPMPPASVKDVVDIDQNEVDTEITKDEIRSYFPETWLWEMHKLKDSGEVAIKRRLPHTITEWIGEAICVHPKYGLGISEPATLSAFQPFFVSFNLPYSVIRGESVAVPVTVSNYLTVCLQVDLQLERSESFKVMDEFNKQNLCICGEESKTTRFHIKPLILGTMNITIYAYASDDKGQCENSTAPTSHVDTKDVVTHQLLVEPEGFPKEDVFNYYFCPQKENGTFNAEVDLFVPNNIVNDSARAYISVTGDLMGPAITGLERLVRLPLGCGEQNMVLFTPIIYILDYLILTNQINDGIKHKAVQYLQKGYQQELKYRHSDGSYSAFGSSDFEGSTWLTAFVVKSFAHARSFINIDDRDLSFTIQWIRNEQMENGCFAKRGNLFNKIMQGGLDRSESLAPLTAYVLISLLEANLKNSDMLENALLCIKAEENPSPYSLALFAYALALAEYHEKAMDYLKDLQTRATKSGNMMFWNFDDSTSAGIGVEIAGYYMLAMLHIKGSDACSELLPVVYWISKQRNANGGFVSTQDTVIALQALAKYSSYINSEHLDLMINMESDDFLYEFSFKEENKLVTQVKQIPVLPTVVDLKVVGKGCGLAQFTLRYSVAEMTFRDNFELNVESARQRNIHCDLPNINICMRYKTDGDISNMIVVEVNMVSGYIPDKLALQKILNDQDINLKRYEIDGNAVNFYFNELTNEKKCFQFNVKAELEVRNQQEARVKLFDYYEPELQISTTYNIPSQCAEPTMPELTNSTLNNIKMDIPETDTMDYEYGNNALHVEDSNSDDIYPMDGFVDVAHDLDFPDGIEGNQPVSVLPPINFMLKNDVITQCPTCLNEFPENFTVAYCSSQQALRISIKNPKQKKAKILKDFSPCLSKPKLIKKFSTIEINEGCKCVQLEKRGIVFVYSAHESFWTPNTKDLKIHLSPNVYVIQVLPKAAAQKAPKIRPALCRSFPLQQCYDPVD